MKLDKKKIQPWLKSRPWYTKEQAAKEDAIEAAKAAEAKAMLAEAKKA